MIRRRPLASKLHEKMGLQRAREIASKKRASWTRCRCWETEFDVIETKLANVRSCPNAAYIYALKASEDSLTLEVLGEGDI